MPPPHGDHTPQRLGTIRFRTLIEDTGRARADLPYLPEGEILLDVCFEARDFPFQNHCRHARLKDGASRRTFANMVFSPDPPGVCVGPWPGWRDIPPMPAPRVRRGASFADVRLHFRGDEQRCAEVRGLCTLPPGADQWITVESGHHALVPRSAELYRTTRLQAAPRQVELRRDLADAHPRLLLSSSDIPSLRRTTTSSRAWREILHLLNSWDLPPGLTPESKTLEGPECLRGEDKVLLGAILALVDPSAENIRRARQAYLGYLSETASAGYEPLTVDTQSGETLFILALGYDWLNDHLTPAEQARARDWLFTVAEGCWSFLGYERRDYAQAHYLGCALGVVAFAFLFWDTHPRAREWTSYLAGVLDVVCAMLPEDGFYPHGINLWIYEYGFLLRWLELYRICAGHDCWQATEHWRNASRFRGSVTSHDGRLAMTFGDPQYRVSGDAWMHLLIGARTDDPAASALGEFLAEVSHESVDFRAAPPRRRVYEFLYGLGRETNKGGIPPAVEIFPDGGQVSVRSADALFCYRGGPPLGWSRYRAGEFGGYGHADPAHGAFLLLYGGSPLVCGPGPVYRRETAHHSCPTVDGFGQIGDSCVWLPDFFPPSTLPSCADVMVRGSRLAIASDLAPAYLPGAGIRRADRSLFVDLEQCIIGADRIRCDRRRSIRWHLSSRYPISAHRTGTVFRLGPPGGATAELALFGPAPQHWQSTPAAVVPGYTNDGEPLYTLSIAFEVSKLELVWCLSLGGWPAGDYLYSGGTDWQLTGSDGTRFRRHTRWVYPEGFDADAT